MNIKKCLITIVPTILIAAVTHAQEASEDLAAEKRQLAQEKDHLLLGELEVSRLSVQHVKEQDVDRAALLRRDVVGVGVRRKMESQW